MQKEFLDLSQPLFCKKDKMICEGQHFKWGDEFNWRKLGLSAKQVSRLFDLRMIVHAEPKHDPYNKYGIKLVAKTKQNNWFNVLDINDQPLNQGALKRDDAVSLFHEVISAIENSTDEGRSIASNYKHETADETDETVDDDAEVL